METYTYTQTWSPVQKILFRVLSIYLLLYICSNQFVTTLIFDPIWGAIVPIVGKNILGVSDELKSIMSGSGDGIFNYVISTFFSPSLPMCSFIFLFGYVMFCLIKYSSQIMCEIFFNA